MSQQQCARPDSVTHDRSSDANIPGRKAHTRQETSDAVDEFLQLHLELDLARRASQHSAPQGRSAANVPLHSTSQAFQIRRKPVGTGSRQSSAVAPTHGSKLRDDQLQGSPAAVPAQGSRHGRADSVMNMPPIYSIESNARTSSIRRDGIAAGLQTVHGSVAGVVTDAGTRYQPVAPRPAKYRPNSERRCPDGSSPARAIHPTANDYLPHDVEHFDITRFVDHRVLIDIRKSNNRIANFCESTAFIEAGELDSNVTPHLRMHVLTPYIAPWDMAKQAVRYGTSSQVWREKKQRVKELFG